MSYKKFFSYIFLVYVFFSAAANVSAQESTDLLSGGQIDFSFEPVEIFPPMESPTLIFQPDGKILGIGRFIPLNSRQNRLYRFLPNGQPDTSFNAPITFANAPNTSKYEVCALQTDGKIVCSYLYYDAQNTQFFRLFRLNPDGSPDASFNYTAVTESEVKSIAVLPNGQILIGGYIRKKSKNPVSLFIARINADGSFDDSFGIPNTGSFNNKTTKIIVQPDGKILMGENGIALRRYNADGTLDAGFPQMSIVRDFILLPGGKILVERQVDSVYKLARLNSDGSVDPAFQSQQTIQTPFTFAVQTDGKILINTRIEASSSKFERLGSNGELLQSFMSYFGAGTLYLSPNNSIFLAGSMHINNKPRGIAKIHGNLTATRRKAFDFDGDGKADIAVFRPSDGVWYIHNSATNTYRYVRFGLAGDKPVPADYDGDTKADIAVYRPSNSVWYRLRSSDGQFEATHFGIAEDIPTQNDYDGDGRDDISIFRPSTGIWYRLDSSTGNFGAYQFGLSGDKPEPGDYDGDGKADFAVYRPSEGVWYNTRSIDNSYQSVHVGYYDGDIGTPADFDGDGRIDLAYFKDFTGAWYGLRSGSGTGFYLPWGSTGDIPVPADYDGDGKDEIAVWRPSTGEWWIINLTTGAYYVFKFGLNGDIPAQSAYVR